MYFIVYLVLEAPGNWLAHIGIADSLLVLNDLIGLGKDLRFASPHTYLLPCGLYYVVKNLARDYI